MMRLEDFIQKRWKKEGHGKLAPKSGMASYFYLLYTHFWKLVLLNFLFIVFSIPIITFPAALVSLNRGCIKLVRDRNAFIWNEFWDEFKASFVKSLPLGLVCGIILLLSYYLLSLSLSNGGTIYSIVFLVLGLLLLLIGILWGGYVFVLLAMLQLSNKDIIKNAFIILMLDPKRTLWSFLTLLCSGLIIVMLFPISILPMAICMFSVTQYTLCHFVNIPVQKWIIAPYEAKETREET